MNAVGDCILARPFVRDLAQRHDLALKTPFPQLFVDLGVKKFVKPNSTVPYVQKATREYGQHHDWRGAPKDKEGLRLDPKFIDYDLTHSGNITYQLGAKFPMHTPYMFDLPQMDMPQQFFGERVAVIRPTVHRTEFDVPGRNPEPGAIGRATVMLNDAGYTTISIANGHYEKVEQVRSVHRYDFGELSFNTMLAIMMNAKVIVSGPGFGMLLALAARRPHLAAIWGARGGLDNPGRVFPQKCDKSRVTNFSPDMVCHHLTANCGCDKRISRFDQKMERFINDVSQAG